MCQDCDEVRRSQLADKKERDRIIEECNMRERAFSMQREVTRRADEARMGWPSA